MSDLKINKTIPSFSLEGTNGSISIPSNAKGKKLIIYFYPKDSTPGCTNEGIDFTEAYSQFKDLNVEIYGISRDSIKSHENFKKKYNFSFDKKIENDDIVFNKTVIDSSSLEIINGSIVDYQKEMIGSSFVIKNPQAASSCGCGLSFSV